MLAWGSEVNELYSELADPCIVAGYLCMTQAMSCWFFLAKIERSIWMLEFIVLARVSHSAIPFELDIV